jgi:hypothetical protein
MQLYVDTIVVDPEAAHAATEIGEDQPNGDIPSTPALLAMLAAAFLADRPRAAAFAVCLSAAAVTAVIFWRKIL